MTTTREISMAEMTDEQRRVYRASQALHRDGGTPAGALELLAAIVEERTWEKVGFGGFRDFVVDRAGLRCEPTELLKVLALRHPNEAVPETAERMERMRREVRTLLAEEIEKAADVGRPKKDSTTIISDDRGYTATTVVARLKRDDPDLAAKVVSGEVSAYAAARAKGWKPPRIQVTTPKRTAAHLRKYMSPGQLAELARLLLEDKDTDG